MNKNKRQELIGDIIRAKRITNQQDLLKELEKYGIQATQASISRDMGELGVGKIKGIYSLPAFKEGDLSSGKILDIDTAGENLIVVKTPPGQASMTALAVDTIKIPGVVGTVAGDDTFFVAVKSLPEQKKIRKQIAKLIK